MSRVEQMGEILSELEEQHPMLPLKAAFQYAEAILDGRPIPLPMADDAVAVAQWCMSMPKPMEYLAKREEVHFIRSLRVAGQEWGVHIELKVGRSVYSILVAQQEGQCDRNSRCTQPKGHEGACQFSISGHARTGRSGGTGPLGLPMEPSVPGVDSPS